MPKSYDKIHNEIQGRTYLPAWYWADQRRLHRKAEFSLMRATRDSHFSNPILMKFVSLDVTDHFLIP